MIRLFDISLQLNGFPILKAKAELDKIVHFSEEEFSVFLQNKKREIVNFHLKNNPFYKNLVNQENPNWHDLPVLNKKNLQQVLNNRLSRGYTAQNCYLNKTSGSSGTPFVFAKDQII